MNRRLLLLIIFVIVASLLLFLPMTATTTYFSRTIENAGHTPLFFVGTLFLLFVLRHDLHIEGRRLYALAGLVGAGAGFASEVIQQPLRRDASWEDVLADCVGALLALAMYALFDRRHKLGHAARASVLLIIAGCLALYAAPVVRMARAYLHRDGQFPVLASFDSDAELAWIVSFGLNREIRAGALDVDFHVQEYPGVSFYEPVPDWSRFGTLVIDVENPDDETLHFGVRVHDQGHGREYADRFNRRLELAAGRRQQFRISLDEIRRAPRNHLMNMAQIENVTLFRIHGAGAKHLRLYSIRLE